MFDYTQNPHRTGAVVTAASGEEDAE